jgi:hypothetical protein
MSQVQLPSGENMNATDFSAIITDTHGAPSTVIRSEETFSVDCEWYLQGPDAPNKGISWRLRVALESIGPGDDFVVARPSIAYVTGVESGPNGNRRVSFSDSVELPTALPAGSTLLPAGETERSYHVTALLTSRNSTNTGPASYAAMYDLGVITVFDSDL